MPRSPDFEEMTGREVIVITVMITTVTVVRDTVVVVGETVFSRP